MSRIRTNFITNRMANGAPTVSNGLVVSGVTTTTSLNVTGNVSVGGTLTYEDVTNIDSVGMITARTDITLGDSIIHLGDTDTKMRFPADNNISFDTAGSERLRIHSNGNLLLGTTNSTTVGTVNRNLIVGSTTNAEEVAVTLNVMEGTNNRRVKFFLDDDDGVYGVDTTSSTGTAQFVVRHATSERLRIDSSGRLLVGTTTEGHDAADNLTIADSGNCGITIRSGTSNNGNIYFSDGTSGGDEYRGYVNYNHSSNYMILATNGSERLRIDSGGRIGVGGISPSVYSSGANNLVISAASGSNAGITIDNASGGTDSGAIFFSHGSSANAVGRIRYYHSDDHMDFYTANAERLRIDSAGRVLIGGTSAIIGSSSEFNEIVLTGKTRGAGITLQDVDANTRFQIRTDDNGDGTLLNASTNHPITIRTNNTERLRIASDGYVSGNVNVPCWFGTQDTQYNISHATWTKVYNLGNNVVNSSMNNGGWDESNGRYTVQTGQAGTYTVYGGAGIDDIQANDYVQCAFYKNGSRVDPLHMVRNAASGNQIVDVQNNMIINLSVGDYVEFYVYHNEGTSESTEASRCFFGGYRLAV